ncbi:MAG: endonuclease III [Pantoea sp. Brub]|nr:endonuclease III [Pantoea sp. Brub]
MNKNKRIKILNCFKQQHPYPNIELDFTSPFELLIAVMLSAQSTDIRVNKVTKKLYKIANTPKTFLELGIDNIKNYINTIGIYNIKAINIVRTSYILLNYYKNNIPSDRYLLESLPGVGRKTANVILNNVYNKPTIAVDTHVFRVCNRTKFLVSKNVKQLEDKLVKTLPNMFKKNISNWMILHGRYICKSRKPNCNVCIIKHLCEFPEKNNFLLQKST